MYKLHLHRSTPKGLAPQIQLTRQQPHSFLLNRMILYFSSREPRAAPSGSPDASWMSCKGTRWNQVKISKRPSRVIYGFTTNSCHNQCWAEKRPYRPWKT